MAIASFFIIMKIVKKKNASQQMIGLVSFGIHIKINTPQQ